MRSKLPLLIILSIPAVFCDWQAVCARAAQTAQLQVRVLDDQTGQPIPVRMHLTDARGRAVKPPGVIYWHDHFVVPGVVVLELRPGGYRFEMERGPEYKIRTGHFKIRRGDADSTELRMERFVDMKAEGWWSGDLHVHRPAADMPLLMAAEDLHVAPIVTWSNDANAWENQPLPTDPLGRAAEDRLFHLLAGKDARAGGTLLYFQLPEPLALGGLQPEIPSSCDFLIQARRFADVHVDIEKPFWWDVPVWIASGMVDSIGL